MNSNIKYIMPSIFWAAFVLIASLLPNDKVAINIRYIDKFEHLTVYFVLALLSWIALYKCGKRQKMHFWVLCLSCVLFGFVIEILQHILTSTRHFDWYDVLANTTGVLLFASVRKTIEKRL